MEIFFRISQNNLTYHICLLHNCTYFEENISYDVSIKTLVAAAMNMYFIFLISIHDMCLARRRYFNNVLAVFYEVSIFLLL